MLEWWPRKYINTKQIREVLLSLCFGIRNVSLRVSYLGGGRALTKRGPLCSRPGAGWPLKVVRAAPPGEGGSDGPRQNLAGAPLGGAAVS